MNPVDICPNQAKIAGKIRIIESKKGEQKIKMIAWIVKYDQVIYEVWLEV